MSIRSNRKRASSPPCTYLESELSTRQVATRLDRWMTAHHLSIFDIEASLDITYQTVYRARKGNKAALSTTLAWLVFGYGEERVSLLWNHDLDPFNPYMEPLADLADDIQRERAYMKEQNETD